MISVSEIVSEISAINLDITSETFSEFMSDVISEVPIGSSEITSDMNSETISEVIYILMAEFPASVFLVPFMPPHPNANGLLPRNIS